jgi:hypothetical protein
MTELEKVVLWGTAIATLICLVGPANVFRIAGHFFKCLAVFVAILLVTIGWPLS